MEMDCRKENMNRITLALALALLTGCATAVKYPPTANWTPEIKELGPVKADSGKWPLSLNAPPHEQTYYSALKTKAAKQYGVPVDQIVLGEVDVEFSSELVGTIRSWKATAVAGQKMPGKAP